MTAKKAGNTNGQTDILNEVNRVPMSDESRGKMTLNIYDLQFLVRLQDVSNDAFREELREIYKRDNEALCKSVSTYVCEQVAEVIKPIWGKLEDLATGQEDIKVTIGEIKNELKEVRDRVFITDADRFDRIDQALNPWSLRNMLLKAGVVVISVLLALILLLQILNPKLRAFEQHINQTETVK